jgi:hypothetical protein
MTSVKPGRKLLVGHAPAGPEGLGDAGDVGAEEGHHPADRRHVERALAGEQEGVLRRQGVVPGGRVVLGDARRDQRAEALADVALGQPGALGQLLARAGAFGEGAQQPGARGQVDHEGHHAAGVGGDELLAEGGHPGLV